MFKRTPANAVALLVVLSACGPGAVPDTTSTSSPPISADTSTTTMPVAAGISESEGLLEGDWFDSDGRKTLVVRGDVADFFDVRGPLTIDTGVDPLRITLPSDEGQVTAIFKLEDGRLQLVLTAPDAPLPESVEQAAADDQGRYFVLELFRTDVLFSSGVWTPVGDLPTLHMIYDVAASADSLLVTGTAGSGFFVSTDRGATWKRPEDGIPPDEPVWALATIDGRLFAGTQGQGVFISDDGGKTWTPSSQGLAAIGADCPGDSGAAQSQILDIAGFGSTVFVVSFCGVSRSDDLGETWREINAGLPDHFGSSSLAVGDGVAYVSIPGSGVSRLDWETDRWQPASGEVELPTAYTESAGAVFAASTAGLRRSQDGGETWEEISVNPGRPVVDVTASDGFIFAVSGGVFWSDDLGDTWTPYNTSDLPDVFDLEVQGDRLFAIGRHGVFSAPLPDQLPSPVTATPGEVPEGFQTFDGSAHGFTIALPGSWLVIDVTIGDQQSIADQLETIMSPENADIVAASSIRSRKTEGSDSSGLVMIAFGATGGSNVTVNLAPRTGDDTVQTVEDGLRTSLEASGNEVNSVDRLEVSGRDSVRIAALLPHEFGTSEFIHYIVLGEDTIYTITLSSPQPGTHVHLIEQVINTFILAGT